MAQFKLFKKSVINRFTKVTNTKKHRSLVLVQTVIEKACPDLPFSDTNTPFPRTESLTQHDQLCDDLRGPVIIPEPELDLPGVLPRAPAEQQAAVGRTPLYPHTVVLQQLLALPEPLHLHGLLAVEGQLEDGVLPHLDDHRLTEHTQVLFSEPRGVCKETTVTMT